MQGYTNYCMQTGKTPRLTPLLCMRLTTALLLLIWSPITALGYAQGITLSKKNAPLKSVLEEIKQQSGYQLFYNDPMMREAKPVTMHVQNASLQIALDRCFAEQPLDYTIQKGVIIVKRKESLAAKAAQDMTIGGVVSDDKGTTLPGVSVLVKGTSRGTTTDTNGRYSLQVPSNATLVFSLIGYGTQELSTAGKTALNVQLMEESQALNEVVVVGYGTQKKATVTGSVASVKSEEIVTTKNENVQNMLTGKVSGVRITQNSSEPGDFNNSFDIRGLGAPLIIIDGVPRDNIARLDPNDIENISVLKDAAAAVYGVRAANGVVLITTKKGQQGVLQLTYQGNQTWQVPAGLPTSLDAIGYMTLFNEKLMHNPNGRTGEGFPESAFEPYRNGSKVSTDWYTPTIKDVVPQMQHNLSASGGNENTKYFMSAGYTYQDGFLRSGDLNYKRYNIRSNVSSKITKDLTIDLNLSGILDEKNQPYQSAWWIIRSFWRQSPLEPIYANNNPAYIMQTTVDGTNPVAMSNKDVAGYQTHTNRWFQSNISLTYQVPFVAGLQAKALFSYDYNTSDNKLYQRQYDQYTYDAATDIYKATAQQSPSTLRREYYSKPNRLGQLSLNYDRTFNDHSINALLLFESSVRNGDNFYAQRELSIEIDQLLAGNSNNQQGYMNFDDLALYRNANNGLIGRLNYAYKGKYLAEFSFRRDGSSKFPEGKRYGFFPGGSVGWRISEEGFFKNSSALDFVDNLKLRASYGELGDDGALAYQFLQGYSYPATGDNNKLAPGSVFDGQFINSLQSKGLINPNITWFVSKMANLGVDFDAWQGKLGVVLDVFRRDRSGLLAQRNLSLPSVIGAELPQENLNSDRTQGVDLELNHRNRIGQFNYFVKGTFSYSRTQNRYVERARAGNSYDNWRNNTNNRYNNVRWGLTDAGRYMSYADLINSPTFVGRNAVVGDYIYEDWNGDGIISDLDWHPIGYDDKDRDDVPLISYGLTLGGSYKGFDLNMLFQGTGLFNVSYIEQLREPLWGGGSGLAQFLDRWHPVDPNADPYDPNTEWVSGHFAYTGTLPDENSTYNIQDASYLRLKSIELGYTFPEKWISKIGIKGARVFVNGYNILTFTDIKYVDPEHPSSTYGYLYPLNKTYSVGLNVQF